MSLADYQRALALMVMQGPGRDIHIPRDISLTGVEVRSLAVITNSPGLKLTSDIQQSWSRGRPVLAAQLTLSLMQKTERDLHIDEWLASGNRSGFFFSTVALNFLTYLGERLPDPSHILSICQFELAAIKAQLGALSSGGSNTTTENGSEIFLRAGPYASLVSFHTDPSLLLDAVSSGRPLPELEDHERYLLFAPGIPGLFRYADEFDAAIWRLISKPTAASWLRRKWPDVSLDAFLWEGVTEKTGAST